MIIELILSFRIIIASAPFEQKCNDLIPDCPSLSTPLSNNGFPIINSLNINLTEDLASNSNNPSINDNIIGSFFRNYSKLNMLLVELVNDVNLHHCAKINIINLVNDILLGLESENIINPISNEDVINNHRKLLMGLFKLKKRTLYNISKILKSFKEYKLYCDALIKFEKSVSDQINQEFTFSSNGELLIKNNESFYEDTIRKYNEISKIEEFDSFIKETNESINNLIPIMEAELNRIAAPLNFDDMNSNALEIGNLDITNCSYPKLYLVPSVDFENRISSDAFYEVKTSHIHNLEDGCLPIIIGFFYDEFFKYFNEHSSTEVMSKLDVKSFLEFF